jgi:hypothetical protein
LLNILRIRNVQKDNKLPLFAIDFDDDNRIEVEVSIVEANIVLII